MKMELNAIALAEKLEQISATGVNLFSSRMAFNKSAALLRGQSARIAELEADLAKAREVPRMPEPAGKTTSHDGEFYWNNHLPSQQSRFGANLYTEQQVRAMFERNKG